MATMTVSGAGAGVVTPVGMKGRGEGPGVRDRDKAVQQLNMVQQATARWADFNAAVAAGYKRNPSSGDAPIQHYIHDGFDRHGNNDNVANPATLMFDVTHKPPKLVGVMISAYDDRPLPDFGAGAWHRHPGDEKIHMHIWFDRSVDQGAFENALGYV